MIPDACFQTVQLTDYSRPEGWNGLIFLTRFWMAGKARYISFINFSGRMFYKLQYTSTFVWPNLLDTIMITKQIDNNLPQHITFLRTKNRCHLRITRRSCIENNMIKCIILVSIATLIILNKYFGGGNRKIWWKYGFSAVYSIPHCFFQLKFIQEPF